MKVREIEITEKLFISSLLSFSGEFMYDLELKIIFFNRKHLAENLSWPHRSVVWSASWYFMGHFGWLVASSNGCKYLM